MIDISCILINYNTSQLTVQAVQSIIDTAGNVTYEIVVVDNASTYEDYQQLHEQLTGIKNVNIVRSRINTGFGSGNMIGVQHARPCMYYAFINNDAILHQQ